MSIKTTQMDGDLALGRNLALGGNMGVAGSGVIGGNLKVRGWLEAKNIKGVNKGIFTDPEKLRAAYPNPADGWVAGVGVSTPFETWIGDGGVWKRAVKIVNGEEELGTMEIVIDNQQIDNLNTDVEGLRGEVSSLNTTVGQHTQQIETLRDVTVPGVQRQVNDVSGKADANTNEITALKGRMTTAEGGISAINASKGRANGIAPLDNNGRVPAAHLPGYVDDVVEFSNVLTDSITIQTSEINKQSTDEDCAVFFDPESNKFVLGVLQQLSEFPTAPTQHTPTPLAEQPALPKKITIGGVETNLTKAEFVLAKKSEILAATSVKSVNDAYRDVFTVGSENQFTADDLQQFSAVYTRLFLYYDRWADRELYADNSLVPHTGKVFVATETNQQYRWSGTTLTVIGSDLALGETASTAYPGDKGKKNAEDIAALERYAYALDRRAFGATFINANTYYDSDEPIPTLATAIGSIEPEHRVYGTVVTFLSDEEGNWKTYQWQGSIFNELEWADEEAWKPFGSGGSTVGNIFNVTAMRTLNPDDALAPGQYDNKQSAIAFAIAKKAVSIGVQITFASSEKTWETYQYIGLSEEPGAIENLNNWINTAAQSAGTEPLVNINYVAYKNGISISETIAYNLASAIEVLTNLHDRTNIDYVKGGMVITYKSGDNKWERKQLIVGKSDYTNPLAWEDFGGNGEELTASDTPERGGTAAFSTGGAYSRLFAGFTEDISPDGTLKIYQAVNAADEPIGNRIEIPLNQGGGGSGTVTSFRVMFKDNPVYASASGQKIAYLAARSYTQEGEEVVYNKISNIVILDGLTGIELRTINYLAGEASSTSMSDYKFALDFSEWFEEGRANRRGFIVRVTDQQGNQRTLPIDIVAIDVTVEITKALNECRVGAGSGQVALDNFYRFENNLLGKDGGIDVTVELLYNDEWHVIGEENVRDTFSSHSVTLNPSNLFGNGERMQHGSYLLRVHGYAPNARVEGNYVYTSIMCVDSTQSNVPVVGIRYNAKNIDDELHGTVKLYDNIEVEVAAYTAASVSGNTEVTVYANDEAISRQNMALTQVYTIPYQVQNYAQGDIIGIRAVATYNGNQSSSPAINVVVAESAIDIVLKEGAAFAYDFALRTNADSDKTITCRDMSNRESETYITMEVNGSNWSSNGFKNYLGQNSLAIKENVTAQIPYRPFGVANAETSGLAVQFAFATNNIKDSDAMLMHCYDPTMGAGFYVKGNVAGIYCNKGQGKNKTEERKFRCGEKITMAVVVEPSSIYRMRGETKYCTIKMYLNGEMVACLAYIPEQSAIAQSNPICFDGRDGDFYLYYIMAYQSHYAWLQAFNNYLAKLTDVTAMRTEFANEDVLNELGAPSLSAMSEKKMPYYVVVAPQQTFSDFDGDTDTSTKFSCTLFYFNPQYPCLNFKATNVQWRRQGTTSAKRPVKNDRFYLNKPVNKSNPTLVTLLNPDDTTELGRNAIELARRNYIMVTPDAIPVQVITVKVDYSDSSNANDCGVCDMMNATFRAMGAEYQTPAQRAYNGTFTVAASGKFPELRIEGRQMDHSTKNHPIAAFRATDETLTDAWFHAKGNWKEDKGEQVALGFQKTPGYNLGCKNYGDFIEFFGTEGETLNDIERRFREAYAVYAQYQMSLQGLGEGVNRPQEPEGMITFDTSKLYLLSLYCGRDYRFLKYEDNNWVVKTGSMRKEGTRWIVEGTVLNPVTGFELLAYQGFDWWQGVSSVADMMDMQSGMSSWVKKLKDGGKISASTFPAWTQYFECMIDDDQLQIDLALGKKVPYELYRMMKFCNDCNMVEAVEGNDNRFVKDPNADKIEAWRNNLWKYASPESVYAYTLFTDYLAATDQRAKNMQPMWFLEDGFSVTNGVYSSENAVRMYLNKVYDCDTCNGKDNDGGCTVDAENDPNKFTDDTYTNPYSGYGSTLFANTDITEWVYTDGTQSSDKRLSLKTVASAMRKAKTNVDGMEMVPFSPEGAQYFFVEKRLKFWKKLISSFDGEHKYIEFTSSADALYFYALQGLGLTALPQFIEQRWRFRDGYYQTGNFYSGVLSGRIACSSNDAKIRIRAAKTGYFGIGHDASGNLDEAVFLEAGQVHEFTQFSHQESALLYIYQADRMSEIDLSEISLDGTFNFGVMTLVEKLTIGSDTHTDVPIGSYTSLSTIMLGNLPFLRELDLRNTTATSVDASQCPRIESILAENSHLTSCTLAQTSPITTLHLPGTMTELQFINLPNLSYPGGLTLAGMGDVQKVMVSGCGKIDAMSLISGLLQSSSVRAIGLRDVNITASVEILRQLKATRAYGLDENGNDIAADKGQDGHGIQCSGLTGRWILTELIEESELNELRAYFRGLGDNLINSQYSMVRYDDTVDYCENITNLDNNTGYQFSNDYVASGHFKRLEEMSHGVRGLYNPATHEMEVEALDDENYNFLADGTSIDLSDQPGIGYDFFKHVPNHWYKGINDFKNQRKYSLRSVAENEPISTASRITRAQISTLLVQANSALVLSENIVGQEPSITLNASNNVYAIDVDGMKQVRWPGINSDVLCCVFLGADGKIISTFKMGISNAQFDFMVGEDYIFCDVPVGAVRFMFTTQIGCDAQEAIAVDSSALEAIEPDWVYRKEFLVGIYGMGQDGLSRARSISNTKAVVGTVTSTTSGAWTYDANGVVTNMSVPSSLNRTRQDCINLCEMRGEGFHAISYEQSKDLANIIMELVGTRDIQAYCGRGCSPGYTTGTQTINGKNINAHGNVTLYNGASNVGNLMFGIQNFVACNYEWMAHIAANVISFKDWKAKRCPTNESSYPIDARWHIYDVQTDTERVVQGINPPSGYCIGRIRHGRFMDYVPSKMTSDNSQFNKNYSDGAWYSHDRCRVVGRAGYSANAYGGLGYSGANSVSSVSGMNAGSRLAFSGRIVWRQPPSE